MALRGVLLSAVFIAATNFSCSSVEEAQLMRMLEKVSVAVLLPCASASQAPRSMRTTHRTYVRVVRMMGKTTVSAIITRRQQARKHIDMTPIGVMALVRAKLMSISTGCTVT